MSPKPQIPADDAPDLQAIMMEGLEQFDLQSTDEGEPGATPGPAADDKTKTGPPAAEPPEGDETDGRFKTLPEANNGYKHLQADFTRVTQENAELKRQLAADTEAKAAEAAKDEANKNFRTFASEQRRAMLDAIDALDPDDSEYKSKVADIQAEYDLVIYNKQQEFTPASSDKAPLPPAGTKTTQPAPTDEEQAIQEIVTYAHDRLSSDDVKLSKDDPLFWAFASRAPETDEQGKELTAAEQIDWAIGQTLNYRASIAPPKTQQDAEQDAINRAAREQGMSPAARTAPRAGASKSTQAFSLNDALADAEESRRIT